MASSSSSRGQRSDETPHCGDPDERPTQCRDNCSLDGNRDQTDTDGDLEGNGCGPTPLPEPGLGPQLGARLMGLAVHLPRRARSGAGADEALVEAVALAPEVVGEVEVHALVAALQEDGTATTPPELKRPCTRTGSRS